MVEPVPGMIIVVMGVAGSGKTTVGTELAERLGWKFVEGDDFHPTENVARMAGGEPLRDSDREKWLAELREAIGRIDRKGASAVVACSALRESFRTRLRSGVSDMRFVLLQVAAEVAAQRVASRPGHFMPATLVAGQFAAMERENDALQVDGEQPVEEIVDQIVASIGLRIED